MDVRSAAQTDHARSIAILIGVADADHTDHELRPVPATLNSLRVMQRVLTDPHLCGWPGDRITVLRNPENAGRTARSLRDLMRSARDTLLVYYAGEANLTTSGQLCLALADTAADAPDRTGLSYSWLARALRDSPARRKAVVLDCCLPGRTGQYLDPVSDQIAELSDVEGVYTLTSTTRHHPAPVFTALQQRPRPTVFTGQLVEMIEAGLPGGPQGLTLEDFYPALRQRLVSMGLPPPNQRGTTGGPRPLVLARNVAPGVTGAAGAAAIPPPPAIPQALPASALAPAGGPAAGPDHLAPAATLTTGPSEPAPTPTPTQPNGPHENGARHANGTSNGNGDGHLQGPPTTGSTPAVGSRPITGQTPAVGSRPITGQTPVLGARGIAGPEPPSAPSPDDPLPSPDVVAAPAGARDRGLNGHNAHNGHNGHPRSDDGDESPRRLRRMWVPAIVLALALLVPAMYVLRPSKDGGAGDRGEGGVQVDLRDVGSRTISLGRGVQPISLLQDDHTLWVQSGAGGSSAELTKIDLDSGEVVANVPLPESDSVGTVTAGAGSLWVTTSSVDAMGSAVVRIDPDSGEVIATIDLPSWLGPAVFADGSLWVATVQQPVGEELGATPNAMSSAANGLRQIDPETNRLVKSFPLEATALDIRAMDDLVLVSTESTGEEAAVVAISTRTEEEVARIPVTPEPAAGTDVDAASPWMVFAADPYAVRIDREAEAVAAVTGPRQGIDLLVPNGEQMWELRPDELTVLDGKGDKMVTVAVDGTPLAAAAAGRGAVWIAYQPSDEDEVLVTRVPAAELVTLAE